MPIEKRTLRPTQLSTDTHSGAQTIEIASFQAHEDLLAVLAMRYDEKELGRLDVRPSKGAGDLEKHLESVATHLMYQSYLAEPQSELQTNQQFFRRVITQVLLNASGHRDKKWQSDLELTYGVFPSVQSGPMFGVYIAGGDAKPFRLDELPSNGGNEQFLPVVGKALSPHGKLTYYPKNPEAGSRGYVRPAFMQWPMPAEFANQTVPRERRR